LCGSSWRWDGDEFIVIAWPESLPPIASATDGVTDAAQNEQDNANDEEEATDVIEQGKFNKPTDEQ
jgi:hypothetical protein